MTTLMELAWTQLWQVTVVATGIGMVTKLYCRRRPHLAHVLWLVVLVKCVTPPIWSSPTGVFSWAELGAATTSQSVQQPAQVAAPTGAPLQHRIPEGRTSEGEELTAALDSRGTASPPELAHFEATPPQGPSIAPSPFRVATGLGMAWLLGAMGYAAFVLLATVRWWRTVYMSRAMPSELLLVRVAELARRLGIRVGVRLWVTREPIGPLSFGWIRPTIVIPEALTCDRSADELEPLLAHELIHVRRGDALVGLLQVVVQCLWWFHPLIWWANRRIVLERERCCDEEVVASLSYEPASYARTLLEVLEMKRQMRWIAAVPGVRRFEITRRRLERILVDSGRFQKRMPRGYWLVLLLLALVLIPGAGLSGSDDGGAASPPEQAADDQKTSAAALVQGVYVSFAWVEKARTFRIRTEAKHTHTDEELRWQETHPPSYSGGKPNPKRLYMETEWAWNEKAVFHRTHSGREEETDVWRQTQIWDGTLAIASSESNKKDSKQYGLAKKASRFFTDHDVTHQSQLPWGPGGAHNFWWLPTDVAKDREMFGIAPQDFELVGQEEINGRKCHALESKVGHWRMYIGVADGRLYRRTCFSQIGEPAGFDRLAFMRKVGGPAIKTTFHWSAWLQNLEPAQFQRAQRELQVAEFPFMRPRFHQNFDDYREVAPGCWLPFRQTFDSYNVAAPEPFLAQRSEQVVKHVVVNQPLAEDQFRMEMVEGVKVEDWRYDPYISYTYRKVQTEEERVALWEAAKKERAKDEEKRHGVIKSRMGKAPQALPQSDWLNGGPVSWEQFHGKTVVIHFWDVKSGNDRTELPPLVLWHENSKDSGIAVICIHPPTDDLAAVRKKLEEFGANYPVLIDAPPTKDGGIGALHEWFGISAWSPMVLLNRRGLIAGHGMLVFGDIREQVRRLVAAKD